MDNVLELALDSVVFCKRFYFCDSIEVETVGQYCRRLNRLPPVTVTPKNTLIDGYHRWLAHRFMQRETIRAVVLDVPEEEVPWHALRLNASQDIHLSEPHKCALAMLFIEQGHSVTDICEILKERQSTLEDWMQIAKWVEKLVALYPQVKVVELLHRWAFGRAERHLKAYVMLTLEKNCYQWVERKMWNGAYIKRPQQVDKFEQKIAFDPRLCFEGLRVLFCRPDGTVGAWNFGPDETPDPAPITIYKLDGKGRSFVERWVFTPDGKLVEAPSGASEAEIHGVRWNHQRVYEAYMNGDLLARFSWFFYEDPVHGIPIYVKADRSD